MSEPSFYSPPPARVDVRETHVSVVFLAGDRAYKLKKPVRMPFLDYSTLERRRRFCGEEVRLNQRFAPDIYLGVRSIAEHGADLVLADPDDASAVEYAVVMRRFDEEADARTPHRTRRRRRPAGRAGRARTWRSCTSRRRAPRPGTGLRPTSASGWRRTSTRRDPRSARSSTGSRSTPCGGSRTPSCGAQRTCSSDASPPAWCATCTATSAPSHIVIEARELSIVDCVEFDERMRRIDVAADLAFLTMDLERLGALPLARGCRACLRRAHRRRRAARRCCRSMPATGRG